MSSTTVFVTASFLACLGIAWVLRCRSGSQISVLSLQFLVVVLGLWGLGSILWGLLEVVSLPALASADPFWNWIEAPVLCLAIYNGIPAILRELWPTLRLPQIQENLGAALAIYSVQLMRVFLG